MTADIIILGAGLTGLTLAKLLQDQGKDFLVLEARDRVGGRIKTIKTDNGTRVECGATWFFPHFKSLSKCLRDVNVNLKDQFMSGYTLYEYNKVQEPRQILTREDSDMLRIEGGTSQIVERLHSSLDSQRVVLSEAVVRIARTRTGLEVESSGGGVRHCQYLVSTLPPQLLLASVEFQPGLPDSVRSVMAQTHTWMGDSVKTILTYSSPWWRRNNLSGALYSNTGPVVQMYDQSDEQGAALVGFMDEKTAELGPEERREEVISQLVRVFGSEAADYTEYHDTIWRSEKFTMPAEAEKLPRQNNVGHKVYQETYMEGRLYIGGSETSTFAGGFMEGAVYSANTIANKLSKL